MNNHKRIDGITKKIYGIADCRDLWLNRLVSKTVTKRFYLEKTQPRNFRNLRSRYRGVF